MARDQVRVEARIHFLSTEEGGRDAPLLGGSSYRPNHNFFGPDNRNMSIGVIDLAEGELVAPGDTIERVLTLSLFPGLEAEFRKGRDWRIQEGAKLVATAAILQVLDPED